MSGVARELVEWDWAVTERGDRLHAIAYFADERRFDLDYQGDAVALCGVSGRFSVPGIFSRMSMMRCARCCDNLGWPRGQGSPKNQPALRELVIERLASFGVPTPSTTASTDPSSAPEDEETT